MLCKTRGGEEGVRPLERGKVFGRSAEKAMRGGGGRKGAKGGILFTRKGCSKRNKGKVAL